MCIILVRKASKTDLAGQKHLTSLRTRLGMSTESAKAHADSCEVRVWAMAVQGT